MIGRCVVGTSSDTTGLFVLRHSSLIKRYNSKQQSEDQIDQTIETQIIISTTKQHKRTLSCYYLLLF